MKKSGKNNAHSQRHDHVDPYKILYATNDNLLGTFMAIARSKRTMWYCLCEKRLRWLSLLERVEGRKSDGHFVKHQVWEVCEKNPSSQKTGSSSCEWSHLDLCVRVMLPCVRTRRKKPHGGKARSHTNSKSGFISIMLRQEPVGDVIASERRRVAWCAAGG